MKIRKVRIKKDIDIREKLWYSKHRGKVFSVYKTRDRWGSGWVYHLTNRSLGQRNRKERGKIISSIIHAEHCKEVI